MRFSPCTLARIAVMLSLKQLFAWSQYFLPQHFLSRLAGRLARSKWRRLKNFLILSFIRLYKVDLSEAESANPDDYPCFDAFFTRALKPGVRPLAEDPKLIISPADGTLSQIGKLTGEWLIQAKGRDYSLTALLADAELAKPFKDGGFATIYLSPRNYHRIHMPVCGYLTQMLHLPGRLFSVNAATAAAVENLFARNERVVCLFDTELGPMAVVLIGALLVGGIETVWHGLVTPPPGRKIQRWTYPQRSIRLERGEELGRFHLGSTVIVLFRETAVSWLAQPGQPVRVGEALARQV
jgi:phosphatidylserine decarboxylase